MRESLLQKAARELIQMLEDASSPYEGMEKDRPNPLKVIAWRLGLKTDENEKAEDEKE